MRLNAVDVALSESKTKDFIDKKYGTIDSLDDLGSSVLLYESQYETARLKLQESTNNLRETVQTSLTAAEFLLSDSREAALNRHILADDVSTLLEELTTASTTPVGESSAHLVEQLEALQHKLGQLELARTYVRLLEQATRLRDNAVKAIRDYVSKSSSFDESALSGYVRLQEFVSSVKESCAPLVESSAINGGGKGLEIVSLLRSIRNRTWKDIKSVLSTGLLESAERLKWPMKVDYSSFSQAERTKFEHSFTNLLRLEEFGSEIHNNDEHSMSDDAIKGLYPLQALVQPIAARFKFHFEGARPTNRLDKPEFYFTHILNVIHEHRPFMETVLQPLARKSSQKLIVVTQEFIHLLLPILSRKIRKTVPVLLHHPSLLAHTVYQTLIFDSSLRDQGFTSLTGTSGAGLNKSSPRNDDMEQDRDEWEGLSEVILGNKDWFDAWLAGEQKFAEDIYNEIISAPEAWQLVDSDENSKGTGDEDLKPTTSARRIKGLIERVTEQYQPLPRFAHKAHFLITIQISILESYLSRISSSLDAYETLSSSFMKAVPGALAGQFSTVVDTRHLTSGTQGLKRLIKAYASAKWIKDAMENWGEELFFLELWAEINKRSALRARAVAHPSLPSNNIGFSGNTEGTLFDELIAHYDRVLVRAFEMMIKQVCYEVESDLKHYINVPWEDSVEPDAESTQAVPSELIKPLSTFSSSLRFFATASIPPSFVTTAHKRIVATITHHLTQRVVRHRSKGRFTSRWGKEFVQHCRYWVQASEFGLSTDGGPGKVRRPAQAWDKLVDTAALLSIDEANFRNILLAVDHGPEKYSSTSETLGLTGALKWEEAKDVLRARVEGLSLGQ